MCRAEHEIAAFATKTVLEISSLEATKMLETGEYHNQ